MNMLDLAQVILIFEKSSLIVIHLITLTLLLLYIVSIMRCLGITIQQVSNKSAHTL